MKHILILSIISFIFGQEYEKVLLPHISSDSIYIPIRMDFENEQIVKYENPTEYERGFKDALESLALLVLELDLKNERKTYGEMFDILYERHQIKSKQCHHY